MSSCWTKILALLLKFHLKTLNIKDFLSCIFFLLLPLLKWPFNVKRIYSMCSIKIPYSHFRWRYTSDLRPAAERHLRSWWEETPSQGYGETVTSAQAATHQEQDSSRLNLEKEILIPAVRVRPDWVVTVWGVYIIHRCAWSLVTGSQTATLASGHSLK